MTTEARRVINALPTPPTPTTDTTIYIFGCQVLAYIIAYDVYGNLSDEDLESARYAANVAVGAKDMIDVAREKVQAIKVRIAITLENRKNERAQALASIQAQFNEHYQDRSQDPSSKVPTHPRPPTQPPPAMAVRPDLVTALKSAVTNRQDDDCPF